MKKTPHYAFGRRIAAARKALGITQRALAARAGITPVFCNRLERGHNLPSIALLKRMAKILGVEAKELL